MAGDPDDDDVASLYLRRLRGDDAGAGTSPPPAPPLAAPSDEPAAGIAAPSVASLGDAEPVAEVERQTSAPPPPSNPEVAPGDLPIWMASDGLTMLRKSDFKGAAAYYEKRARQDPSHAEGWLGIGAAMVGVNDLDQAVKYLLKGMELQTSFPVGVLISETRPGNPKLMLQMADRFKAEATPLSSEAAINVLEELMRNPTTPQRTYNDANERRKACRDQIKFLRSANPEVLRDLYAQRRARGNSARVLKVIFAVLLLAGLGAGGWFGYHFFEGARHSRQGLIDFKEATRMGTTGIGNLSTSHDASDPGDLYYRSYTEYKQAVPFQQVLTFRKADELKSWFMIVRAGEATLERARDPKAPATRLTPAMLAEVEATVKRARATLNQLDPTKTGVKKLQSELSEALQRQN